MAKAHLNDFTPDHKKIIYTGVDTKKIVDMGTICHEAYDAADDFLHGIVSAAVIQKGPLTIQKVLSTLFEAMDRPDGTIVLCTGCLEGARTSLKDILQVLDDLEAYLAKHEVLQPRTGEPK